MSRTITSVHIDGVKVNDPASNEASTLSLLERAESFICGFEGDEDQEGIDELLSDLRAAIAQHQARAQAALEVIST
ncbi:hypothetical protein [Stutzerimonas stutzeri]|nr:hypothetical protein [Stutzerimonas stutzeri]CAB5555849.1 Uncharacterised protein [Stutzerimonas stutzeri]CAB5597575.1 Uncharacterised protein [Stutzerimonas stutzeri]CAC9158423.1 Uncharacterised protein [Stutzerimonas stutzeri]CAD0188283.1 Hypothetical_protein [Stutzerimonas stutzeri]